MIRGGAARCTGSQPEPADCPPTVTRAGGQGPLHTTGVGKALLATRDEAWLAQYFTTARPRETVHSICDEGALRHEITNCWKPWPTAYSWNERCGARSVK